MNYETSLLLHLEKMRDMVNKYVISDIVDRLEIVNSGIRRTKEHEIVTRRLIKTFAVTANKRKLAQNYLTYPYGYKL